MLNQSLLVDFGFASAGEAPTEPKVSIDLESETIVHTYEFQNTGTRVHRVTPISGE